MEPFGINERAWTEEEKEAMSKILKYDKHTPLKIAEMVMSGQVEANYFNKLSYLVGGVTLGLFFYFPIVRQLPVVKRLAVASVPAGYTYWWGQNVYEELQWMKTHAAYQKWIVYHGQHPKLFV